MLSWGASKELPKRINYYPNKTFAIKELLKTKKGSSERRTLINYMTDQGLVPCKKTWLYELLMEVEEGYGLSDLKLGEEWGTRPFKKRHRKDKLEVKVKSLGSNKTFEVGDIQFDLPLNGRVYTKREALKCIARTKKGSVERGAMIRFMIQEGYVPCKEHALYSLIRRVEVDRLPAGSDVWGKQSSTTYEDTHHDDDKIFGKLKRTWCDIPIDIEGSKWYNSDRKLATCSPPIDTEGSKVVPRTEGFVWPRESH